MLFITLFLSRTPSTFFTSRHSDATRDVTAFVFSANGFYEEGAVGSGVGTKLVLLGRRHSTVQGENMESRTIRYVVTALTALLLASSVGACSKEPEARAHDPGVRGGDPGAGLSYPGL